jgi:hypothetical protein
VELNLGPYTVRVVRDERTDLELADLGVDGDSDVRRGVIRVRSDLDVARQREVMVHELLHHVIALTHLQARWSEDEQEEVIRALAPWLASAVTLAAHD